jgi:hypothetical protein
MNLIAPVLRTPRIPAENSPSGYYASEKGIQPKREPALKYRAVKPESIRGTV